ncbi:F0F1 ATP synthase subunit delta [Ignisphaera sp. 4213-co]|uniref:F0F1 ATP synthase subunit delta n=1 Tax=Ignisphaera cupida TaxID=3050454 RepID=A0ABD4Z4C1_9CREN|nr:F0F1 ATP synthase subunit delta [Ignisphaera sp. 4213-co]MDK6027995.1 F0F1 ATP synthase subunit delta [Ignisphaera sp. 4213-co]
MSVEDLRKAVLEKAKAEAESILRKAEEEAKRIVEEALKRKSALVEQKKAEILARLNPDARVAECRYKARIILAEAKSSIIKEIRELVVNEINALSSDKRLDSIKKLIDESIQEVFNTIGKVDSIVVKVSPRDIEFSDTIKKYVEEFYKIRVEGVYEANIVGGIIVECMNGDVIIDNSYDERLERVLRIMITQISKTM